MADILLFPAADVFRPSEDALRKPALLTQEYKAFCKAKHPQIAHELENIDNHTAILKKYLIKNVERFNKEFPAPEGYSWGFSYEHGVVIVPNDYKN